MCAPTRTFFPIVAFFCILAPGALAAERLYLTNGDRLSGQIWAVSATHILLESEYGVKYSLPRSAVLRIVQSEPAPPARRLQVQLRSGEAFAGTLIHVSTEGLQIAQDGAVVRNVAWADLDSVVFTQISSSP